MTEVESEAWLVKSRTSDVELRPAEFVGVRCIECVQCGNPSPPESRMQIFTEVADALAHLRQHRKAGDKVPIEALRIVEQEGAEWLNAPAPE
jgi:hypothetical protein